MIHARQYYQFSMIWQLEKESFLDDQGWGVADDENVENQEDMEGHEGNKIYRGEIVWAKYSRYYYPGIAIDVDKVSDSIHKNLPTTAEKYIIHWYEEHDCPAIQKHKFEMLGRNWIDTARVEQLPSSPI